MNLNHKPPSIAFVYDRVNTNFGGAETLLSLLLNTFPSAPLFTSVYHKHATWVNAKIIKTSFLQKFKLTQFHRYLAPLMPMAFESLDLSGYDVIVSFTSAEAKGILTKPNQLHISYIFSPTKYLYDYNNKYPNQSKVIKPLVGLAQNYLKWWDKQAIFRADQILTLSQLSADKIKNVYGLKAQVIYPPVDEFWRIRKSQNHQLKQTLSYFFPDFFITVSRLVPYKRIELAIKIAHHYHKYLFIVGEGSEKIKLIEACRSTAVIRQKNQPLVQFLNNIAKQKKLIVFLGNLTKEEIFELYSQAKFGLCLGDEDFGLTAAEMISAGLPIMVSKNSGITELIGNQIGVAVFDPNHDHQIYQALDRLPKKAHLDAKTAKLMEPKTFVKTLNAYIVNQWQQLQKL